jgi:hypothetical protein
MSPSLLTIFKWETLREVGPDTRRFREREVPGKACEVELISAEKIQVWRADDGRQHFCHGLTFGGKEAPGGVISPYGNEVPTILHAQYELVQEAHATAGDVLIWRGIDRNEVVHSAILTGPVVPAGKTYLDYASRLQSKNGMKPEANLTLEELILEYGESYNTYRRR